MIARPRKKPSAVRKRRSDRIRDAIRAADEALAQGNPGRAASLIELIYRELDNYSAHDGEDGISNGA
jgi:hypothetical protein